MVIALFFEFRWKSIGLQLLSALLDLPVTARECAALLSTFLLPVSIWIIIYTVFFSLWHSL